MYTGVSMYFLIAIIACILGIVILLKFAKPNYDHQEHLIDTDRWIARMEFGLQKFLHEILRILVVHLVGWYRFVTRNITIHKSLRQKIRKVLYDHHTHGKGTAKKDPLNLA
jgi:hypothetical protein